MQGRAKRRILGVFKRARTQQTGQNLPERRRGDFRHGLLGFTFAVLAMAWASRAQAQQQAQGFALERFHPSAPGGGWFVMDALDMQGALGGAMALTLGYEHNPLRVTESGQNLAVVSDQLLADFGFAVTYGRFRLTLNMDMPLLRTGQSGSVGGYAFSAPSVNPGATPDTLSDYRLGFDARILGHVSGGFRLGASAQLVIPNGHRADFDTDDTFRGMLRALVAGDLGRYSYAGQLGVHIRPLDDSAIPGSPRGSELLFGAAGGAKVSARGNTDWAIIVGPEVYGATAFHSFFTSNGTAIEGLLSCRLEGTRADRMQMRFKLGVGAGINQQLGAPEWRILVGVELFNHNQQSSPRSSPPSSPPSSAGIRAE
jgi:hypothetical protein